MPCQACTKYACRPRLSAFSSSIFGATSRRRGLFAFVFSILLLIVYRQWKAYTKKAVAYWRKMIDNPDIKAIEDRIYGRIAKKVATLSDEDIKRRVPEELDFVVR